MANMTLVLDVVSNVDYSKIEAEVQNIRDRLAKIPDKVKINIQVGIDQSAAQQIQNLQRDIERAVNANGASSSIKGIAGNVRSVSQSISSMGASSSHALHDQIDAITGVSTVTKSARDSADAMRMAWAMAAEQSRKYASSLNVLTRSEKSLRDWSQMKASPIQSVSDAYGNFESAVTELRAARAGYDGTTESADRLAAAVTNVTTTMQEAQRVGVETDTLSKSLSTRLSELAGKFGAMFSGVQGVRMAIRAVRKLAKEAIAIDDSMTQLRIVTGESDEVFRQYGDDVAQTAQKIGSSITDVIDATTVFARLGYSLSDSSVLAELTAMLQRVGDIDAADAQASLTSIIKAFDIDVADMEVVMDKLVTVGNGFPISVSEIATGMMNASSALAAAGNSFDKSVALLAAANTTLQDASKASTGLRTITARIRKTDSELNDLGEAMTESAYEDLVGALSKYNVALRDSNGEYRDTYDTMKDIAGVWDEMTSAEQAALAELVAGNRQQTVFYSIIKNFDKVAAASLEAMGDAPGAMKDAYAVWMESVTAHIETLKAAFQGLASDVMSSNMLKLLIDAGTGVINIADGVAKLDSNVGSLALTLGSIIAIVKSIKSIS